MNKRQSTERITDLPEFELVLHDAEFKIWIMDLCKNGHMSQICARILDKEEQKKAIHNSKFLLQRGMVKLLLGDYLGKNPEEVRVKKDHMGKPFIESECCEINYSHSGQFFMLGASKINKLGVDIQIPKKLKYDYPTMIFSKKELKAYESLTNTDYYVRYKIVSGAGISSAVQSYHAKVDTVEPTSTS